MLKEDMDMKQIPIQQINTVHEYEQWLIAEQMRMKAKQERRNPKYFESHFINDACRLDVHEWIPIKLFFLAYKYYCREQFMREPNSRTVFTRRINQLLQEKVIMGVKRDLLNRPIKVYQGITLIDFSSVMNDLLWFKYKQLIDDRDLILAKHNYDNFSACHFESIISNDNNANHFLQ